MDLKKRKIHKGLQCLLSGFMAAVLVIPELVPAGVEAFAEENVQIETEVSALKGASAFLLDEVELKDDYFTNAFSLETQYLLSFDTDKWLAGFRETAGLDMKGAVRYGGWENSLMAGHDVGHYMTACAQAYASLDKGTEKTQFYQILTDLVDGLKECQDKIGTGFIFCAPIINKDNIEQQFDNVEQNRVNITTEAWVPWYTMQQLISGLIDIYKYTGYEPAKEIAVNLGTWVYKRVSSWNETVRRTVLNIEYGGMNDCLYELYALTGNEDYAVAAHVFDETDLFEAVLQNKENALNNRHANTTIPKFLGALNRYVQCDGKTISGETIDASVYLAYAEAFWDMVVEKHTYITGGNSEWEHFGQDYVLDGERTNCNAETCNSYNMLKLSRMLFMITGDIKYADFYENTFLNAIMSSQNPETGMSMYFQPMATGYFKVYATPYDKFWCCVGTGMENFTKLQDSLYFKKENNLIVNQYIASSIKWEEQNVIVEQQTDIPKTDTSIFTITSENESADINIYFRLPDWLASDAVFKVNKNVITPVISNQYACVSGPFSNGTEIEVTLPMGVFAYSLPDSENTYAFKYGPVVLSALLGSEDMTEGVTGVNVTTPANKKIGTEYTGSGTETISIVDGSSVDEFMKQINRHMEKDNGKVSFKLNDTDANLTFVTHYSQYKERYGIYWTFVSDDTAVNTVKLLGDKKKNRLEENLLDTVQPGYGQYENDELHQMTEGGTGSESITSDGTYRYAKAGGTFSYHMNVNEETNVSLIAYFRKDDNGKTMKISVKNQESGENIEIYNERLAYTGEDDEYSVIIPIPSEALSQGRETVFANGKDNTTITIIFEGAEGEESARLCSFLYTVRTFGSDTSLEIFSEYGELTQTEEGFCLTLSKDMAWLDLSFKIGDKNGYLMVDKKVVDDTHIQKISLSGETTKVSLVVYGEDHETFKEYTLTIHAPKGILDYFVDCGDHDPSTVSSGDEFGKNNSVTEQILGVDSKTGYTWGLVDDSTDRYNGSAISNGLYTANTWCFEQNSCKDGLDKTETNRYTKNQYENGIALHLDYEFELKDGTYIVEAGFANPWNCSDYPTLYADIGTENESVIADRVSVSDTPIVRGEVTVKNGKLTLNFRANERETLAINVTYIKISHNEEDIDFDNSGSNDNLNPPTDESKQTENNSVASAEQDILKDKEEETPLTGERVPILLFAITGGLSGAYLINNRKRKRQ